MLNALSPTFLITAYMSRLTTFRGLARVVLEWSDGTNRPEGIEIALRSEPIRLPLCDAEQVNKLIQQYVLRIEDTRSLNLAPERRVWHDQICHEVIAAYEALLRLDREEQGEMGVEKLITPLRHVVTALDCIFQLRDHDAYIRRVTKREWLLAADDDEAHHAWFQFKLCSIRPCLFLLLDLLELLLEPAYQEFWDEPRENLRSKDWYTQFICDSECSQKRTMTEYPKQNDVIRPDFPKTQFSWLTATVSTPIAGPHPWAYLYLFFSLSRLSSIQYTTDHLVA